MLNTRDVSHYSVKDNKTANMIDALLPNLSLIVGTSYASGRQRALVAARRWVGETSTRKSQVAIRFRGLRVIKIDFSEHWKPRVPLSQLR